LAASKQRSGKGQNEIAEWLKQRTTQNTQQGEECLKINYHGTKNVTEARSHSSDPPPMEGSSTSLQPLGYSEYVPCYITNHHTRRLLEQK